nr:hypothetical protein BgiMline_019634 [Biomphalaria glabrata]
MRVNRTKVNGCLFLKPLLNEVHAVCIALLKKSVMNSIPYVSSEACPMNFDSIPVVLCNGDPFKVNIELQNIHGTDYTVQYIKQEILAKKNITNDEAYAMFIVKQSCKTELPDQEKMIDYRKDVVGCDYIELVLKNDNGNNEKKTTDQR